MAVTQQAKVSPPTNESLDTSTNADSYYSLESENEMKDFETDDTPAKHSTTVQTNVSYQHTFVESMSEDETAETSKRVIMEVMSEEESAAENQSRKIVVDVHVEPAPLTPLAEVKETHDSGQAFQLPAVQANKTVTPVSEMAVSEQQISSSLVGAQEVNEISSPTSSFSIQISSTFTVSNDNRAVQDQFESDENVSFATMQPVVTESIYENQESLTNTQPSWENIYEKYRAAETHSNQQNEMNTEGEGVEDYEEKNNEDSTGSLPESHLTEDNAESVAHQEHLDNSFQSRANDSITEIRDSSGEDDSDIEILEDESTVAPPRRADKNLDDLSTEEDDVSENSYESEYTYSQESGEAESNADVNSMADAEEAADESEDDVGGETQEIEEEYEDEYEEEVTDEDNDDVEEEFEDDEEGDTEEEPRVERQSATEENIVALDESEVPVAVSFDTETLCRENPSINFEELKKIVSNVAAVETHNEIVASPEIEATKKIDSTVASPSLGRSENELSYFEVYDATQSVVEQTVNLDYSDSFIEKSEISVGDSTNVNLTFAEKSQEAIDESQKLDTTVEVLSLSTVAKEESSEPPMVFYFGENSVTSIGEEILVDETENSKSVFIGDKSSQLVGDRTQSEIPNAENSPQVRSPHFIC